MKQPKERVAKASTGQAFTLFSAPGPRRRRGLYGLEASNMAEKVTKGEVDALSAYRRSSASERRIVRGWRGTGRLIPPALEYDALVPYDITRRR